jgi:small subunit ribosomal protein S6
MRQYELLVITEPDFPHEDEKKRGELVKRLLTNQEVSNITVEDWGKKQLAYEINKKTEGCYLLITCETNAFGLKELEAQVKLTPSVVRYLLTRIK